MQENRREWFLSPPGIVIVLCFFPTVFALAGLYISEAFQLNGQAVGSLSGALIALVVVILYHQYHKNLDLEAERQILLHSLYAELTALKYLIASTQKRLRESEDTFFVIRIEENYFTVYEACCTKLGLLPLDITPTLIATYMDVKSLFDEARIISQRHSHLRSQFSQNDAWLHAACSDSADLDAVVAEYESQSRTAQRLKDYFLRYRLPQVLNGIDSTLVILQANMNSARE